MKNICIKIDNVLFNIHSIKRYLKSHSINLVIVTKCLKLNSRLIESLSLKDYDIYDTKRDNLNLLNRYKIRTICDANNLLHNSSFRVILSSFEDFNKVKNLNKKLYLNFDFGDQRDGFELKELNQLIKILSIKNYKHLGIMSNIGCFRLKKPSKQYFRQFLKVINHFSNARLPIEEISFGGSNCLPYIKYLNKNQEKMHCNLRIGEAIFLGTIPAYATNPIPLKRDNIFLESDVIKRRPGNRFLLNFGYNHLEQKDISKPEYKIIYQSSEFSLLKINKQCTKDKINKKIIPLTYEGLSKLSTHSDISHRFF